jgi:hypothetical protein
MHERGVDVVVLHGVETPGLDVLWIGWNRAEPTAGQSEALVPGGRSDPLRKGLRVTNSRDMFHQAKKNDLSNVLDVTVVEAVGTAGRRMSGMKRANSSFQAACSPRQAAATRSLTAARPVGRVAAADGWPAITDRR